MEILEMRLDAFGEKNLLLLCGVEELCHVAGASRYDHDILPESRRGREQEQQCQSQRPGHVNSERWDGDQAWRDQCTAGLDAINSRSGTAGDQLGSRSMTEKLRANPFYCPHCAAKYALVKVEAIAG